MTTLEILKAVADVHNRIVRVAVAGDNAILIGDSIRQLRTLVDGLQKQIEAEEASRNGDGETDDGV